MKKPCVNCPDKNVDDFGYLCDLSCGKRSAWLNYKAGGKAEQKRMTKALRELHRQGWTLSDVIEAKVPLHYAQHAKDEAEIDEANQDPLREMVAGVVSKAHGETTPCRVCYQIAGEILDLLGKKDCWNCHINIDKAFEEAKRTGRDEGVQSVIDYLKKEIITTEERDAGELKTHFNTMVKGILGAVVNALEEWQNFKEE